MTVMPPSGPLASAATSAPLDPGLGLGEEGVDPGLEILGAVARVTLVQLLGRQRPGLGQAAGELLVPARHQRRAVGDAPGGGEGLVLDVGVGDDAADQPHLLGFLGAEHPSLEQDLERRRSPHERDQHLDLGVRHHQAQAVDGDAEAARFSADAEIAKPGDLETAADADAPDHGDGRMAAGADGIERAVEDLAVGAGLLDVGPLGLELGDVVARRKGFHPGAGDDDAAHLIVR